MVLAGRARKESRGGHTRDDYPMTDPFWSGQNVVLEMSAWASSQSQRSLTVRRQLLPKPPPELAELLEEVH